VWGRIKGDKLEEDQQQEAKEVAQRAGEGSIQRVFVGQS